MAETGRAESKFDGKWKGNKANTSAEIEPKPNPRFLAEADPLTSCATHPQSGHENVVVPPSHSHAKNEFPTLQCGSFPLYTPHFIRFWLFGRPGEWLAKHMLSCWPKKPQNEMQTETEPLPALWPRSMERDNGFSAVSTFRWIDFRFSALLPASSCLESSVFGPPFEAWRAQARTSC